MLLGFWRIGNAGAAFDISGGSEDRGGAAPELASFSRLGKVVDMDFYVAKNS